MPLKRRNETMKSHLPKNRYLVLVGWVFAVFAANDVHAQQSTLTFTTPGPSPWIDVTDPAYGAKCDGVTDDTTAIQNALNAANALRAGGIVNVPLSVKGSCLVSLLNMNNFNAVKIIGSGRFSPTPAISFTGTCATGPCLTMIGAADIEVRDIVLSFPGCTATPCADISQANRLAFHHVGWVGPGATPAGPLINNSQSNFVLFDSWTWFFNADFFLTGPTNNTQFSDTTVFNNVQFYQAGTAVLKNVSVGWTISGSTINPCSLTNHFIPLIQFTGGYTQIQNFNFTGNSITGANATCNTNNDTVIYITLPAASGNTGAATFSSNLILGTGAGSNQSFLSVGNNQAVNASGNVIDGIATAFSLGTGVSLDVGPNIYRNVTTFISGTPASGRVIDNIGKTTVYGVTGILNVAGASFGAPTIWGCTGAAAAGVTIFLSNGSTCGLTAGYDVPMGAASYLNLRCFANAGGVNASDGVITVQKNAVATTITATLGTGTTASDVTHSFISAQGDRIRLAVATQAGTTLSGITCSLERK
jgi:hypothetical protein